MRSLMCSSGAAPQTRARSPVHAICLRLRRYCISTVRQTTLHAACGVPHFLRYPSPTLPQNNKLQFRDTTLIT